MVMVDGKRKMTITSPETKVALCEEIVARGGDRHAVNLVAKKAGLAGSSVDKWYLEYKVYGADHFAKMRARKTELSRQRAAAMTAAKSDTGKYAALAGRMARLEERMTRLINDFGLEEK